MHQSTARASARTPVSFALALGICSLTVAAHAQNHEDDPPAPKPPLAPPTPPPQPPPTTSVKVETTYAAGKPTADTATTTSGGSSDPLVDQKFLNGFRLGYGYVMDADKPSQAFDGQSLAHKVGMRSPHQFLIGYEGMWRMTGSSWLNVILVGNVMASGLEQSKFWPNGNMLIGFELKNSFQLGVGVNLTPLRESFAHTIFAAGWTPRAGAFYVPLHFFFIPDVDGNHRMGVTTGVTW